MDEPKCGNMEARVGPECGRVGPNDCGQAQSVSECGQAQSELSNVANHIYAECGSEEA